MSEGTGGCHSSGQHPRRKAVEGTRSFPAARLWAPRFIWTPLTYLWDSPAVQRTLGTGRMLRESSRRVGMQVARRVRLPGAATGVSCI